MLSGRVPVFVLISPSNFSYVRTKVTRWSEASVDPLRPLVSDCFSPTKIAKYRHLRARQRRRIYLGGPSCRGVAPVRPARSATLSGNAALEQPRSHRRWRLI